MTSPNLRKLSEPCRKCGAISGEYCRHCSGKRKEDKKKDKKEDKDGQC